MPYSFIEIEEKKTKVIGFLFVFIILFYFLTAYLILIVLENTSGFSCVAEGVRGCFALPSWQHTLAALAVALIIGLLHWWTSTSNLIDKICGLIGALPVDPKDTYHQYLKNIVEEVSVAIGGRPLEAWVLPSVSMNAFALEDFNGRAVIGVTEGLLTRLSRSQIEAVVGHEAGHIISGDCLSTTVTCALAEIYEEGSTHLALGLKRRRGRGSGVLVLVYIILAIMRFFSSLIRYFISRQREYRADAVAVRLTRDPLSLAEALKLISSNWRGSGAQGERLQSIFIMNPVPSALDEKEGVFSDMFSTHPPIKNRIGILLNMAHLDEKSLEENLKNFKRASPVAEIETKMEGPDLDRQWFVFMGQQWQGPFAVSELKNMPALTPEDWVRPQGSESVIHAYEDKALLGLFSKDAGSGDKEKFLCPHCKVSLEEVTYEGAPVLKCNYCQGVFVEEGKVSRILIRQDKHFSVEIARLGKTLISEKQKFQAKQGTDNVWVFDCPACLRKMLRQFFVYSYPVEVDRCAYCGGTWFDKYELDILQYLFENKEIFFKQGLT
ncbi:MAG: zinc metalloprotease HtpX [Candidatus Omnitrophota bacterium]